MRNGRLSTQAIAALAVAAVQAVGIPAAVANPVGPNVVAGQATISGLGTSHVTIQQTTPKAIINWQQFNIASNEVTQFIQPDVRAIALNRIFDQNPSQIWGRLQANGTVILLNRNGILFGPNAQVNVGGLIASSLNLSDANFLRGHYLFEGSHVDGWIKNAGAIQAGGDGVYLLAPNVENSGIIKSPDGTIVLAAGTNAFLSARPDGRGFLAELAAPTGRALNLKELIADGGHITLAGRVVNQEGLVQANSVRERNGKIELYASEALTLKSGSRTLAKGSDEGLSDGGTIQAIADRTAGTASFETGAVVDVSGGSQGGHGGFVELSGKRVTLGGRFLADVRAGYKGGRLLIDPVDLDLSGLSVAGMSTVTVSSPDDLRVTGFLDLDGLGAPPGGEGTLQFTAGRDLLFRDVFLSNNPEGLGTSKWNYVGTAANDIVLVGSNLWTGRGGGIDLQAGRDIRFEQGLFHSNLYTVAGGDIRLTAGRDLIAPSGFDSGTFQFMSGIRVGGPGNLTINAGRDFLGSTLDGVKTGPGFLLSNGQAQVTVGGSIGSADNYANITLGTGQITMTAGRNIYQGVVQDKGLVEGTNLAVTANPANAVTLNSTAGDIHLKPAATLTTNTNLNRFRSFYPASFSAKAEQGSIFVESNMTFWPSITGRLDFFAKNQIQGLVPTIKQNDNTNYVAVFVGFGGQFGGQWRIVKLDDALRDPTLGFWLHRQPPPDAPPPPAIEQFPLVDVPQNPVAVSLVPADPQRLLGLSDLHSIQDALARPAESVPAHAPARVSFQTETGDISKLFFDLNSPTLKKEVAIQAGGDLREFLAQISVPEGVTATVGAKGTIDMTKVGSLGSGVQFFGGGTGKVSAGGDLDLANSLGIVHAVSRQSAEAGGNRPGHLDIEVGGNLKMTKSRIATLNGAGISIRGAGTDPVAGKDGVIVLLDGKPTLHELVAAVGGQSVLEPVLVDRKPVVVDTGAPTITAGQIILVNGKPIFKDGQPVRNGKAVLSRDGAPITVNGQVVLIMDGQVVLADRSIVAETRPLGGNVDVGTNSRTVAQDVQTDLPLGIVTIRGGAIDMKVRGDVNVNLSRIATFGGGDIAVASTQGDINAGSGSRDEITNFVVREPLFNEDGTPKIGPDGKQRFNTQVFPVPGSGIFTFHPNDPLPLVFPKFDTPALIAVKNEIVKQGFFGRDTTTLEAQRNALIAARTPEFNREFDAFIDPLRLGNITLNAGRDVVVPEAGIRGRDINITAGRQLVLLGGVLEGRINVKAQSIAGDVSRSVLGVFSAALSGAPSPSFSAGTGGSSVPPVGGFTGSVASASSTAANTSTAQKSADQTSESVQEAQTKRAVEKAAQTAAKGDDKEKKSHVAQSVRVKRGVTIQVDVKPQPGS